MSRARPLLDLMMPVMDGFTVLEHLRADERTHDVPVIVLTAMALDDVRARCEAVGVTRFLTEPFEPDHLTSFLAELSLAA
jgi:CheY-like chemotaxis protein